MVTADRSMFAEPLEGAPHSKQSLRLWLKLLGCTVIVEKRLRARLDAEFATTLPRFDVLAALERHREDGLVTRTVDREDRRSATVRLTRKGREAFLKMAAANERWMDDMFADLSAAQIEELMRLLRQVRRSIDAHPA